MATNTQERTRSGLTVERVAVSAFEVPTVGPDGEEADGTLTWSSTTMVLVELEAGDFQSLGYTYADVAAAKLIDSQLADLVKGRDPVHTGAIWRDLDRALRNTGRPGVGALALSAVDMALWDLKAKMLGLPLFERLGPFHDRVPIYASGGFCNYPVRRLVEQVERWVERGGGVTGLLQVAGLAAGHSIDLSAHCAPAASAHAFCAVPRLRHLEYCHDHVRLEAMLFDGTPSPQGGQPVPDPSRPGWGSSSSGPTPSATASTAPAESELLTARR